MRKIGNKSFVQSVDVDLAGKINENKVKSGQDEYQQEKAENQGEELCSRWSGNRRNKTFSHLIDYNIIGNIPINPQAQ